MTAETDWGAWSREAVAEASEKNRRWLDRFGLARLPYRWDLDQATIVFDGDGDFVVADACLIGTTSVHEGTFLWAWANDTIPEHARRGLLAVREFGETHGLDLLIDAEWPGGRAEGLEMVAVAARVLEAEGTFVDTAGDVTLFFTLGRFRVEQAPRREQSRSSDASGV